MVVKFLDSPLRSKGCLEQHFYLLIQKLPFEVVKRALQIEDKKLARLLSFRFTDKRRPINQKKALDLRDRLLDYLDSQKEDYLDVHVEFL